MTALSITAGIVVGVLLVYAAPWIARGVQFVAAVLHDSKEDDEMVRRGG